MDGITLVLALWFRRGVGRSSGWPTLRGAGETTDVVSICRFLLGDSADTLPSSTSSHPPLNTPSINVGPHQPPVARPTRLILAGYSYGSLHPFAALASQPELQSVCLAVIAIAYPLAVTWALTLFDTSRFIEACTSGCSNVPKFFVMGDADNFTGVESVRELVEEQIEGRKGFVVVAGADHFFGGEEDRVCDPVEEWLTSLEADGWALADRNEEDAEDFAHSSEA
ncbi:hypothetical protein HDU93_009635 [Gonapodya sp. JEL0774]|nr:hypothetical protein HDU93_009635 [Gonapodya sp. JEL0774]